MLGFYLKTYLRNIRKNKLFSISNIISLSIGLSIGLVAFLWVLYQFSFDTFHANAGNIYRVVKDVDAYNKYQYSVLQIDLAERLKAQFPEVKNSVPVFHPRTVNIVKNENGTDFNPVISQPVGPEFFDLFDAEFVSGNASDCLASPDQVVLTESLAKIMFPSENPVGKMLYGRLKRKPSAPMTSLRVSAVIKDFPANSMFEKQKMFVNYKPVYEDEITEWANRVADKGSLLPAHMASAFLLLNKNCNINDITAKIADYINSNTYGSSVKSSNKYILQKFTDIHLYSDEVKDSGFMNTESIKYVYVIAGIGLLLILGSFLNYFGYALILYNKRLKETGVNKFLGAANSDFALRFVSESFITLAIASVLSLFLVEIGLSTTFSKFISNYGSFIPPSHALFNTVLFYAAIFIAGAVPVLYFTVFTAKIKTVNMIMNKITNLDIRKNLWRIVVVAQTAIPVFLIAGGLIIKDQVTYLKNYDPGYSKEDIIQFDCMVKSEDMKNNGMIECKNRALFMVNELKKHPAIEYVTRTNWIPGFNGFSMFSSINVNGKRYSHSVAEIDSNYFKAFNIKTIKKADMSMISTEAFLYTAITEQTAKEWGVDYVNKQLPIIIDNHRIVAVVNNIHQGSFKEKKNGITFRFSNDEYNHGDYIAVKVKKGKESEVKQYINNKWKELTGESSLLSKSRVLSAEADFKAEDNLMAMVDTFSAVTLFMALISIFSSVSYNAERRTKEIGIRKVLGASFRDLFWLITKEIFVLLLLAVITAAPFVILVLRKWLEDFCYRINIGIGVFIITAIITTVIAFITVSYIVIKSSSANPVESLKYE